MKLLLAIVLLMFGFFAYAVPDKSLNDEVQIEVSDIASDVVFADLLSADKADIVVADDISIERTDNIKSIIQNNSIIVQRIRPGEHSMAKSDYLNDYTFELKTDIFAPRRLNFDLLAQSLLSGKDYNYLE